MKKICNFALAAAIVLPAVAQPTQKGGMPNDRDIAKFDVIVYQNPEVGDMLRENWEMQAQGLQGNGSRGFLDGLFAATTGAAYSIASTGILGLASTGAAAVGNLINAKKNQKQQWQQLTAQENTFRKNICSMENMKDFYSEISTSGALDPSAMTFGGIGCLQTQGQDTVLYIACKLDTSDEGLGRILRHSKFQLVLDELVFNPSLCNLPNDSAAAFSDRKRFSFDDKSNLMLMINMDLTSSWINQDIQIFQDQDLGSFSIKIPVDQNSLGDDGVLRYRSDNPQPGFEVQGESFVVPRSYIGVRDEQGNYYDAWGTGQYKVNLTVQETCSNNPDLEKDDARWKADLKNRKKQSGNFKTEMLRVARQTWDAQCKQWVVTLVEAPSKYAAQELIGFMGLSSASGASSSSAAAAAAMKAAAAQQAAGAQQTTAAPQGAAAQGQGSPAGKP